LTSHADLADDLRRAYSQGAIPPLRAGLERTDADGAYAVQAINTRFWVEQGRRIVGRKIGLTAAAVQKQLGVSQPDYGVLFEDMAIADTGELRASRVLQPKAEAEIALILSRDISDPEVGMVEIARAIESVVPAIEIVDSRIANWAITFADTVADNGSSAFFVLGELRRPLDDLDLYSCGMVLELNGAVASIGAGAACLGHPLTAAVWLARTLAARGEPLCAGDVVLTGALGPMVALTPGDSVRGIIGGVGQCSFQYVDDRS
jgi:2-keto-4-pentenoate hydratase